jgi:hypothetical protein
VAFDPSLIPIFNQAQMDLLNQMEALEELSVGITTWVGELNGGGGELIASSVLVGPLTGDAPTEPKRWDNITLTGEGRALVFTWIDNRLVSKGMLNMAGGPRQPNVLKIPQKIHSGTSLLVLIIFLGKMLACEAFYEFEQGVGK